MRHRPNHERLALSQLSITRTATLENLPALLATADQACVQAGASSLLLEMGFTGASLGTSSIYSVVSERAGDGRNLKRVAYVETSPSDPVKPWLAETVARNRGVNVRLFEDVASAVAWLEEDE